MNENLPSTLPNPARVAVSPGPQLTTGFICLGIYTPITFAELTVIFGFPSSSILFISSLNSLCMYLTHSSRTAFIPPMI